MRLKKILGVVTAAVLALSMTLTAFAAPSVSVSGIVTYGNGTDANGAAVAAALSDVGPAYSGAVDEIRQEGRLRSILGDDYVDTMAIVDIKEVTVPEGTPLPVTLTFNVPGVTPDTAVALLCYNPDTQQWERIECKAGQGTITAVFNSYSAIVAFVVDKGTAGTVTSPNTGENSYVVLFGAAAVAAACGVAVLSKKKKA